MGLYLLGRHMQTNHPLDSLPLGGEDLWAEVEVEGAEISTFATEVGVPQSTTGLPSGQETAPRFQDGAAFPGLTERTGERIDGMMIGGLIGMIESEMAIGSARIPFQRVASNHVLETSSQPVHPHRCKTWALLSHHRLRERLNLTYLRMTLVRDASPQAMWLLRARSLGASHCHPRLISWLVALRLQLQSTAPERLHHHLPDLKYQRLAHSRPNLQSTAAQHPTCGRRRLIFGHPLTLQKPRCHHKPLLLPQRLFRPRLKRS